MSWKCLCQEWWCGKKPNYRSELCKDNCERGLWLAFSLLSLFPFLMIFFMVYFPTLKNEYHTGTCKIQNISLVRQHGSVWMGLYDVEIFNQTFIDSPTILSGQTCTSINAQSMVIESLYLSDDVFPSAWECTLCDGSDCWHRWPVNSSFPCVFRCLGVPDQWVNDYQYIGDDCNPLALIYPMKKAYYDPVSLGLIILFFLVPAVFFACVMWCAYEPIFCCLYSENEEEKNIFKRPLSYNPQLFSQNEEGKIDTD